MQPTNAPYFALVVAVFFAYWLAAKYQRPRQAVVLLASYLFCAHFALFYVVLLPVCSIIDYLVGLGLVRFNRPAARRALLGISLAINLGLLIGSRHLGTHWIFPLGLSFYTFQALTYTIDLYRRDAEATSSLLAHLCATSFFPTLLAGPITRVADLARQFAADAVLTREDGGRAFFLIVFGLLKKFLIADYLADNLVNRVFDTPTLYSGWEVLLGVYAYGFQLYYDFSGYTDVARGVALLLGIRLPLNFDRPYLAANIAEFWRRWHISFSSWLRDYLYYALPGKRSKIMQSVNLAITMILGGLWHGFTWGFAIWGLLHGAALAAQRTWQIRRGKPRNPARWYPLTAFVTWQFVSFTWIFFRAASLTEAWAVIGRIGSLTFSTENISLGVIAVLLFAVAGHFLAKRLYAPAMEAFARSPFYVHAAALAGVVVTIQLIGGRGAAAFVYSRF